MKKPDEIFGRRLELIQKKFDRSGHGLTSEEQAELLRLHEAVSAYVRMVAPKSIEALDSFAEHVHRLQDKVASEKFAHLYE